MIVFKTLKYRNFLSTGNNFTVIELDKNPSTLVVGANGAGKSTMLDALSFALFGRPHRNINKPQLCNSINKKKCLVEITFTVNGFEYRVTRGLKPNIFEIWRNGVLLNQNSHNKEYQKILEQNILKLNHKSFHQIVVLGSSSFIPFMQLSAYNRREVIEDLLDINIFSKMNNLLKEKMAITRANISTLEYKIDIEKARLEAAEENVEKIRSINAEQKTQKESQISQHEKEISKHQKNITKLEKEIDSAAELLETQRKELQNHIVDLKGKKQTKELKVAGLFKHIKFFEVNSSCPTCNQGIEEHFKEKEIRDSTSEALKIKEETDSLLSELETLTLSLSNVESELLEISKKNTLIHGYHQNIFQLMRSIKTIEGEIEQLSLGAADITESLNSISQLKDTIKSLGKEKHDLNDMFSYQKVAIELLKDSGIKTKIIKQYLPVINQLVNQYLQVLDFFVHFNLDESFTETIRSRHRDLFTYASFSEGEKQRIDLSLLFTWRQVAKMKNSVATNLLILDETFDSSLDNDGVENLMKILDTLEHDTNIFIISHKTDALEGKFKHKIEFHKKKNFSVMS